MNDTENRDGPRGLTIRSATKDDCRAIAELFQMAAGDVIDYIWQGLAEDGEPLLDVGTRRFALQNKPFSYDNCHIAEVGGERAGMICTFAAGDGKSRDESKEVDPVLAPFLALEEPGSYFVAGIACYEKWRGVGIGSWLLAEAEDRARSASFDKLSLIAFDKNAGAVRLYERLGYETKARSTVVPSEAIRHGGDLLLMVRAFEYREGRKRN